MFALFIKRLDANRQDAKTAKVQRDVAAALLFGVFLAGPVSAANSVHSHCSEAGAANLHIQITDLVATPVSHTATDEAEADPMAVDSPDNLLTPRAEAAIRDAFGDENSKEKIRADLVKAALAAPVAGTKLKAVTKAEKEQNVVPEQSMNTKLPGVSDDDLSRYKKQMYRRDI